MESVVLPETYAPETAAATGAQKTRPSGGKVVKNLCGLLDPILDHPAHRPVQDEVGDLLRRLRLEPMGGAG
jgi:hypothetical protein